MSVEIADGWATSPKKRSLPCNGELIRYYRERRGWSQEEFAARAGYSDRLIRKAEAGRSISADTIEVLAIALSDPAQSVTPEELVSDPLHMARSFCDVLSSDERNAAAKTSKWLADDVSMWVAGDPELYAFAGDFYGPDGYDLFCRTFFDIMYCPDRTFWRPRIVAHGNEALSWGLQCMQLPDAPQRIHSILVFRFKFERGKIVRIEDEYNTEASDAYFRKHAPHLVGRGGSAGRKVGEKSSPRGR